MRTSWRAATAIALVAVTSSLASGCVTTGGGGTAHGGVACPAAGTGQARVVVVVDALALGSSTPSVVCVVVASGASGIAALQARATLLGQPAPRFDVSGLLCAIDGAPVAPHCGDVAPGGYQYWSYWGGGTSWTYGTSGPATRHLSDGAVEGWRFSPGGADQAPATPPTFSQLIY